MDKLYSKKVLVIKAVFCLLLAPLYTLISRILYFEDAFLHILISIVSTGCLFTIPFWFSLLFIKKHRVSKVGKYIVYDFIVCFAPSVLGILTSEIISTIVNGKMVSDGFVTLIFTVIFSLTAMLFWLLYWLFSYKEKY